MPALKPGHRYCACLQDRHQQCKSFKVVWELRRLRSSIINKRRAPTLISKHKPIQKQQTTNKKTRKQNNKQNKKQKKRTKQNENTTKQGKMLRNLSLALQEAITTAAPQTTIHVTDVQHKKHKQNKNTQETERTETKTNQKQSKTKQNT